MIDDTIFHDLKALYHTFGCKLNFAETSTLASTFAQHGIHRAVQGEVPDLIVINSCSVTEMSDKKCRQTIRSLHRRYPDAPILVTGCYAQLKSNEIEGIDGVAVVAGSNQKHLLLDYLEAWLKTKSKVTEVIPLNQITEFVPSCSSGDRTRYFLKVQDGCDYWCTYCTIPRARGRSRSGTIEQLVTQAKEVAELGGKEIVITGVNIGDFGKGRDDTFFDLIQQLDEVEGIERFRISSIEPNLLSDEIIKWVSQSKRFMPHFHIPLQSGDNDVLKLMHRHYDTDLFRHRIEMIRQSMPDAFIGVDLIVGARGETPQRFDASKAFVESLPISRLHVFPYSERPGTKALDIDLVVDERTKRDRDHLMLEISDKKLLDFSKRFIGTVRPVLLEHQKKSQPMAGFTDNYLRVNVDADASLDNHIVDVYLESLDSESFEFTGKICNK